MRATVFISNMDKHDESSQHACKYYPKQVDHLLSHALKSIKGSILKLILLAFDRLFKKRFQ